MLSCLVMAFLLVFSVMLIVGSVIGMATEYPVLLVVIIIASIIHYKRNKR